MSQKSGGGGRIPWIDIARGTALLAMTVYHFAWDLEFFGYVTPGMTAVGGWKMFARCIATSFLFLVGVSLVLSHAGGVRTGPFMRRLAMIVAAAAAVTTATWFATPDVFIFFGILHQIAFASVAGLLFLRLPAAVTLAAAAAVLAAPHFLTGPFFDHPAWWWTGLSETRPRSSDYVPVFPWFAGVLSGIAAARLAQRYGLFDRLARIGVGRWSIPLTFIGRHSLAYYLLHQPVLIGALWLFATINPPSGASTEARFIEACETSCVAQQTGAFCTAYCGCMLDRLRADNLLGQAMTGTPTDTLRNRIQDEAAICSAEVNAEAP